MEDNSGKKFSLQDWVMKRAANQSGAVMSSQSARQYLSENAAEEEVQQRPDVSLEVEMRAVSNGSTISSSPVQASASAPTPSKEEVSMPEAPIIKKEDLKEAQLSLNSAQNPLQQLQIVRLLTDLGDRLRQSEKEREILWKEVEICRKQISDMSGNANKSDKSFSTLEDQINQREVFVKELVEKQIGLEQQLKDQIAAFDTSKQEQTRLQEKLNSVETVAGSTIVRVEDVIAENSKLSKRVEQLGQDKERLARKLIVVEEALTQTQDILKAKALVLLTDHSVAASTNLPQVPAWTGDDTLKLSQPAAPKNNDEVVANPAANLAASLRPEMHRPSLFMVTIITAMIAGVAAFGAIWLIRNLGPENTVTSTEIESSVKATDETATTVKPTNQEQLMAQAAQIANQIEPSNLSEPEEQALQDEEASLPEPTADSIFEAAQTAQDNAVETFKAETPTEPLSARIKSDKSLPKAIAAVEAQAFSSDVFAQHDLAAIYTAGHAGVKIDYAKAAKWFEEAAHNGAANAQYNLGVLYHQGLGVRKDTAKAIELYRVAASNNHPEALYNLAIAYVEGVGVEYNPQIAATYFEKSADGGIVEAAYNLGLLQENGLLGESQPDEAIFWYKIAADKGNAEAKQSLAELKKKLSMTDEDVNRLTQKIAATKPGYLNDAGNPSLPQQMKADMNDNAEAPIASPNVKKPAVATNEATVKSNVVADPVIVSQIQEQLMRLGLYKGAPNGTLSASLVEAIKSYQTKNGLKVDGKPSDDLLVQMLVSGTEAAKANATADIPQSKNN